MSLGPPARTAVWALALGAAVSPLLRAGHALAGLAVLAAIAVASSLLGRPAGVTRVNALALLALLLGLAAGSARVVALAGDPLGPRLGDRLAGDVVLEGPVRGRPPLRRIEGRLLGVGGGRVLIRLAARRAPDRGTVLRVTGRLHRPRAAVAGFDERGWLARRGIHAVLQVEDWRPVGRRGGLRGALDRVRSRALATFLGPGRDDPGHLVGGLVLGADEELSQRARDDFRASGTAHLLAVSGQNVALLAAALSLAVWLAGGGRATAQVLCVVGIVAYVGVVGPSPSVVRAGVAGALTASAWLLSRPVDRWHLFGAGAAVLLVANPWTLLDVGFQLSFAAVAAILLLVPTLERWLAGTSVPGLLRAPLAVSVACTVATAPIGWAHFGRVGVAAAVPANVAAAPAVAPTLWLGLTAAAVEPVAPRAAAGLVRVARLPARYLIATARVGARFDAWTVRRRRPLALVVVLGAAALAARRPVRRAGRRRVSWPPWPRRSSPSI